MEKIAFFLQGWGWRAKQALNEVASTEASLAGACRAAARSVHRIIAVITARFDRLELRLEWPPKHPKGAKKGTFEALQLVAGKIKSARFAQSLVTILQTAS